MRRDLLMLVAALATVRAAGKAAYAASCRRRMEDRSDKDARFGEYIDLYREAMKNTLKGNDHV